MYGLSAVEDETGRNAATLLARLATARTTGKAETSVAWGSAMPPDRTSTEETDGPAATPLARMATARPAGKTETSSAWRYARLPDRTPTERTAGMAVATLAGKAGTVPARSPARMGAAPPAGQAAGP